MTTWKEFAAGSPSIAAAGRRLIERSGIGEGLLATVRGDAPPRIHPVHVRIVDGRLLSFVIVGSAKANDLAADGRYALAGWPRLRELADAGVRVTDSICWASSKGFRRPKIRSHEP